jgi:hypothetical protein
MRAILCLLGAFVLIASQLSSRADDGPILDGSDLTKELMEREQKIAKLPSDEQVKLRSAQQKAAEEPEVLAAAKKRAEAIAEFRMTLRNSMVRTDPKMAEILDKLAAGAKAGL